MRGVAIVCLIERMSHFHVRKLKRKSSTPRYSLPWLVCKKITLYILPFAAISYLENIEAYLRDPNGIIFTPYAYITFPILLTHFCREYVALISISEPGVNFQKSWIFSTRNF
ncbi:hypothetical protein E0198_001067 [Clavispora lusitaniae]|nr:hypothetical protein E0198_001067 [Clavispora lusitaniae]